jgi:hypothetical protein
MAIDYHEIRHFHLFCGLGGGAAGFNRGQARVGSMRARFRCLGGIDSDAQAIAGVMGQTLLLAWSGETFMLNAMPIWVRPVAVALGVRPG